LETGESNRRDGAWNADHLQLDVPIEGSNCLTKKDKDLAVPTPADVQDEATGRKRTLVRHSLDTLAGIIHESARVYRLMRDGQLEHQQGRSLVWVLSQLRAMVETSALERLEEKLDQLSPEGKGPHGHSTANRTPRSTH
jgi:hypothetical protein